MAVLLRAPQRNDKLLPPRATDQTRVVASNECVRFCRLASVPPAQFALAPNMRAQELHILRVNSEAQCAGVNEGSTRASPALLLSSAIDEHWGLMYGHLAFVLNIATPNLFPMEGTNAVVRRTDRIASLEYATLHFRARLAHLHLAIDDLAIVPDLSHQKAHPASELARLAPIEQGIEFNDASAFLVGKSREYRNVLVNTQKPTDPKHERDFHPRPTHRMAGNACAFDELEKRLQELGLLDLRVDGVVERVLFKSPEVLALDIAIGGVAILHAVFPSGPVVIGESVFCCVIADAWDTEALAAHEPVEEVVAVRQWLARDPKDPRYEPDERHAYMSARDHLLDKGDWDPASASTTRCHLANFRLRLMSSADMRNATAAARARADAEDGSRRKRRRELSEQEATKEQDGRFRMAADWLDDPKCAPFLPKSGLQHSKCVTERVAYAWNLGRVLSYDPLNKSLTLNVHVHPVTSDMLHRRYSKRGK